MAESSAAAESVQSHLGFERQRGLRRHETCAGRLLFNLIRDADNDSASSPSDSYMQLAAYDLVWFRRDTKIRFVD
jgi:hypothetical protein